VGRALFDRCAAEARMKQVQLFRCFSSRNAEGFYKALGFELCGEFEADMGPNIKFPSLLMERSV
jgi:hypothetical protein